MTKIGTKLPEATLQEILSQIHATRKELPVYAAEFKLDHARAYANELKSLVNQLVIVGLANSVTLESTTQKTREEVTDGYGDEQWGTGRYVTVNHEIRALVCDGQRVILPESESRLGGTFYSTAEVVARAFLEWGSRYMEKAFNDFQAELRHVNIRYFGDPDPRIYAGFDAHASRPAEDDARKQLEKILESIQLMLEEARAAIALGLERTDPATAEKKIDLLPEYLERHSAAYQSIADEGLEPFYEKPSNERMLQVHQLLDGVKRASKRKDALAVASFLPRILEVVEDLERQVVKARTAKKAYLEQKATFKAKAIHLQGRVAAVESDERFQRLSRDLQARIRENAQRDLTSPKWKVEGYQQWSTNAEALLAEIQTAFEAPPPDAHSSEGDPAQATTSEYEEVRDPKADRKEEREKTQAEQLGDALAEHAQAMIGRQAAIALLEAELNAPYGRARRQASLKSHLGGEGEDYVLHSLYQLSKADVLNAAMTHAIDVLFKEPARPAAPLAPKKVEADKPQETPAQPVDLSAFNTSALFGGRGNKTKKK